MTSLKVWRNLKSTQNWRIYIGLVLMLAICWFWMVTFYFYFLLFLFCCANFILMLFVWFLKKNIFSVAYHYVYFICFYLWRLLWCRCLLWFSFNKINSVKYCIFVQGVRSHHFVAFRNIWTAVCCQNDIITQ